LKLNSLLTIFTPFKTTRGVTGYDYVSISELTLAVSGTDLQIHSLVYHITSGDLVQGKEQTTYSLPQTFINNKLHS